MRSVESNGRETRLLFLVVAIAVGLLFVVAKLRFPSSATLVTPPAPAGPLQRLAARTAFDELSSAIRGMADRLGPRLEVVPIDSIPVVGRKTLMPTGPPRLSLALRVHGDIAVLYLPPTYRVPPGDIGTHGALAVDPDRHLAVVRLPPVAPASVSDSSNDVQSFAYLVAFAAARNGPTAHPVFIGRVSRETDALWRTDLFVIGGDARFQPGDLLFDLDGGFVGLAWPLSDAIAIVPAAAVEAAANDLVGSRR